MATELFIQTMAIVNSKNYRPLILTSEKIRDIFANPNFHEICFYLTSDNSPGRNFDSLTLRYGLLNSAGNLISFDGQIVPRSFLRRNLRLAGQFNFINPFDTVLPTGITNTGITILKIPTRTYFLESLQVQLGDDNNMIGFFIKQTDSRPDIYEVHSAILQADFGDGAGPGSVNTKPAP